MKPRKRGQQYEISYRCPGYKKQFSERFSTYEEAKLCVAQIEYERSLGVFAPPKQGPEHTRRPQKKFITVSELMDDYVDIHGLSRWGGLSSLAVSIA